MKEKLKSGLTMLLAAFLILVGLLAAGCGGLFSQPGETAVEGHRRHLRQLRISGQQFMSDVDTALMTDRPSGLSEKRLP